MEDQCYKENKLENILDNIPSKWEARQIDLRRVGRAPVTWEYIGVGQGFTGVDYPEDVDRILGNRFVYIFNLIQ